MIAALWCAVGVLTVGLILQARSSRLERMRLWVRIARLEAVAQGLVFLHKDSEAHEEMFAQEWPTHVGFASSVPTIRERADEFMRATLGNHA